MATQQTRVLARAAVAPSVLMLFIWMILDAKLLRPNFPIYAQLTS